jgi:4-hydroxy-3-polyprenylbenzoate decarboxylase
LAKFLWIIDEACDPQLDIDDIETFFLRMLERVDWKRDLHFQTKTTIDTLDYSGSGLNQGSKVVIAAVGPRVRELPKEIPSSLSLPDGFRNPQVCIPGVLAISAPKSSSGDRDDMIRRSFCDNFSADSPISRFPLVLLVDDSEFTARSLNNFLWTVFTRSNPAVDIDGIDASIQDKHWGCGGSLVIDARVKSHHAPPLIENPEISKQVDAMAARGGPLAKYL